MSKTAQASAEQPIDIILDAVEAARDAGIRVRIGSFGVVAVSIHGPERWAVDETDRNPGVSPLGAVLLFRQPSPQRPENAAAEVLGVHVCWCDGLEDGLALEPRDPQWIHGPRRHYYAHGYESGTNLRISITSRREGAA